MKLFSQGVSSPQKFPTIRVKETILLDDYRNANWKLLKITEVPLPEPNFQLPIEILPVELD
jgi:hypothetical protein